MAPGRRHYSVQLQTKNGMSGCLVFQIPHCVERVDMHAIPDGHRHIRSMCEDYLAAMQGEAHDRNQAHHCTITWAVE